MPIDPVADRDLDEVVDQQAGRRTVEDVGRGQAEAFGQAQLARERDLPGRLATPREWPS